MSVICEECGKIYHFDPEKLIKRAGGAKTARAKCKVCGHTITVDLSDYAEDADVDENSDRALEGEAVSSGAEKDISGGLPLTGRPGFTSDFDIAFGGIRGRMLLFFFILPVSFIAILLFYSQHQIHLLSSEITGAASEFSVTLSEGKVVESASLTAYLCGVYLSGRHKTDTSALSGDETLKKLAGRKVLTQGYSVIFEISPNNLKTDNLKKHHPKKDDCTIVTHPDRRLIGIPVYDALKKNLGNHFNELETIIKDAVAVGKSSGYYTWREKDGRLKRKFMACESVDGTNLIVASTSYIDDFSVASCKMQAIADDLTEETSRVKFLIFIVSLLVLSTTVLTYGWLLTKRLFLLTCAAERISVGMLETPVEIRSRDEIGALAEAVTRMQDSLLLSIRRLKKE